MPITSQVVVCSDDDPDLLARIREEASGLALPPRGTVRCVGRPLFRTQVARDVGCLLDIDPAVVSWTCLPRVLHHRDGRHVPDFAVTRATGVTLLDAVPASGSPPLPGWMPAAAQELGPRYEVLHEIDVRDGFRLENARDLLRYASYRVSLGDRVRLLALLDEHGPLPLAACMQAVREARDAIGVIAALALRRFLEIELDEARIGPDTRVARFRG
ncbi:hypothetical protein [Microvirga massiliensis]|uniref:hypothetical protein n=1 Tax=Microvirga massiliensis TaxID=1033741 RepID=UPI000660CA0A|nr:hypothetical protein [Microvirga massiliensis]